MNEFELLFPEPRVPEIDDPARDASSSTITRRDFFKIGAAATGGLLVTLYLPASNAAAGTRDEAFTPNVFIRIDPDGTVTFTSPRSEMGQGTRTALLLIVAEELDAGWDTLRVEQAPFDEKYGPQTTGGSASIRTRWMSLRQAAATARALLIAAAAQAWGVEPSTCTTEPGVVHHRPSGRSMTYGQLAGSAAGLPVPDDVPLKDPEHFRLIGQPTKSIDAEPIVKGDLSYGLDLVVPGMLYAVIERCPVFGGAVKSFDASRARAVAGVRDVVEVPASGRPVHVASGVAVVAETSWAAMKGREALVVEWDEGPSATDSSADYLEQMRALTEQPCDEVFAQGDADALLAEAAEPLVAVYELPFLSHAPMEPMNCTAHVQGNRCEVWAPTQNPGANSEAVAEALNLPQDAVTVHVTMMGGGFGRRLQSDFAVEAALVSKAVAAPVKVVWTREDDMQHDFYRPVNLHRVEAVLDEDGSPAALRHRVASTSIRASSAGDDARGLAGSEVGGAADLPYVVPHRRCEYAHVSAAVPRGPWRSVSHTHTTFAVECFLDEMAVAAGKDPYTYRRDLIDLSVQPDPDDPYAYDPQRLKGVLELVAEEAGWGEPLPAGHGRGIACHYSFYTYAAEVVEVFVDEDGRLRIPRVVAAVDCGTVVNPDTARFQVQGAVIDGLSVALHGEITLRAGRVEQTNFHDYSLLRLNEAPQAIVVHFVQNGLVPTGLGEPAVPPVAPALANAIFAATGQRLRTLPLELDALKVRS